jgi:RNA polymerase sigma-70 factor (ECF subfamily)
MGTGKLTSSDTPASKGAMVAIPESSAPTRAEFHAAIAARADRWYAACLRITRSPELAEDALQDALLSAWDKRRQFQHGARLETWIHRIAVNAALQLVRRRRPGMFTVLDFDVADETPSAEDARYADELDSRLDAALARLTDVERVCFVLKHLEQWRLKEIADEIEGNVSTVKQAVFRAVRKLRGAMPVLARAES